MVLLLVRVICGFQEIKDLLSIKRDFSPHGQKFRLARETETTTFAPIVVKTDRDTLHLRLCMITNLSS